MTQITTSRFISLFEQRAEYAGASVQNKREFKYEKVGLGLLFWPGIIVNESRSSKNQDSLDDRIVHLTNLYSKKCLTES